MSKYFLYNKSKNIKPIYDKEIDLSSIAEWIACGFFRQWEFYKRKYFLEDSISIEKLVLCS